jgi:Zn-dependent membrane protease YugP
LLLIYKDKIVLYSYLSPQIALILLFIGTLQIMGYFIQKMGIKNMEQFPLFYLTTLTIRLLASASFLIVLNSYMKTSKNLTTNNFIIIYFILVALEIYYILTNLRPDSKK